MVRIIQEAELNGTIEATDLTTYIKTLLNDSSAKAARETLLIATAAVAYDNALVFYDNEIVFCN
jgi:hypothetical protein